MTQHDIIFAYLVTPGVAILAVLAWQDFRKWLRHRRQEASREPQPPTGTTTRHRAPRRPRPES